MWRRGDGWCSFIGPVMCMKAQWAFCPACLCESVLTLNNRETRGPPWPFRPNRRRTLGGHLSLKRGLTTLCSSEGINKCWHIDSLCPSSTGKCCLNMNPFRSRGKGVRCVERQREGDSKDGLCLLGFERSGMW